jgi:hypothetical protein
MKCTGSEMTIYTRVTGRFGAVVRPRFEGVTLADDDG